MSEWTDIIDKDIPSLGITVSVYANRDGDLAIDIKDVDYDEVLHGYYLNSDELKQLKEGII